MKGTNTHKLRFPIRYGMSIIIVGMFAGLAVMLNSIQIRNKQAIDIVRTDGKTIAFTTQSPHLAIAVGDTLTVDSDNQQQLLYIVRQMAVQPPHYVLTLHPVDDSTLPSHTSSKFTGFIYVGSTPLSAFIFKKWGN